LNRERRVGPYIKKLIDRPVEILSLNMHRPAALPVPQTFARAQVQAVVGISASVAAAVVSPLTAFGAYRMTSAHLHCVMENPRIESLCIAYIEDESDQAIAAIANHPALASFELGQTEGQERVAILARGGTLSTLKLGLAGVPFSGLKAFARMPQLRSLTLEPGLFDIRIKAEDIAELCVRPLDLLGFTSVRMDATALETAATAQASTLIFRNNVGTFEPAVVDALVANRHISTLIIVGNMTRGGEARLAAAPSIEKLWLSIPLSTTLKQQGLRRPVGEQ